ncbi:MAG TPA: trigger factor [Epsilonproteobacteria bacterium]|nr:trigger factor [Campylobacterota bacterium]
MGITVNKVDDVNTVVAGVLDNALIEEAIEKLAKQAAKQVKVDGFRPGKVPVSVVKQLHGDKLKQDAESEALKDFIDEAMKEAGISPVDVLGQPGFKKYEKGDNGIDVEVEISVRPAFDTEGYKEVVPAYEKPEVDEEKVNGKVNEILQSRAPWVKIKRKRMVKDGDMTLIDFEGFMNGEPFEGGKAEKYNLQIGSGQFIPGFEEQLVGMKYDEERTITVTFPEDYQNENLKGQEVEFKVKLHEIQEQEAQELTDEVAREILQGDESVTADSLVERVRDEMVNELKMKLFQDELKPKLLEALVEKFDFALPNNIIEQEIDAKVNQRAQEMSEEELESYKTDFVKLEALRAEVRGEAAESVKATFIVDSLAKLEEVTVEDQEVTQALYYEAYMAGQDPQKILKHYEENNLLPAVKMNMIEDKLFAKLLGLDK